MQPSFKTGNIVESSHGPRPLLASLCNILKKYLSFIFTNGTV